MDRATRLILKSRSPQPPEELVDGVDMSLEAVDRRIREALWREECRLKEDQ